MEPSRIVRYDADFIAKFEKLGEVLEDGDKPAIYRYLLDNFQFLFTLFQSYAKEDQDGGVKAFEGVDEETKRELMRPLSYRQYRLVEGSFSRWAEEEDLVISSIWDFLHDNGRIYEKKVMSSAEIDGGSMILENVYSCLSHKQK
ncbi:MAG: hypothetical protein IKE18_00055 [Oscillospiraceae bacterium]|nr:hypothetical protein [Oscillospiraceae bacterium]